MRILMSIKIDQETYELLKKIKEKHGIPMMTSMKKAVKRYAKKAGVE